MTSVIGDQPSSDASNSAYPSDDRFLWGFPLFALCTEIFLAGLTYLERFGDGPVLSAFLLLIPVALVMLVIAVFGIVALVRAKFRCAAALLLTPLIIALPFLFPAILQYEHVAFDLMRFHFTKGRYTEVIDKLSPAERASKVVFFKWGATGFLDAASYYSLVYDESGEIALPDEERSQAWKDRVYPEHRLVDEYCVTSADHLSGYFYSLVQHCSGDRITTHWTVKGGRFVAPR